MMRCPECNCIECDVDTCPGWQVEVAEVTPTEEVAAFAAPPE